MLKVERVEQSGGLILRLRGDVDEDGVKELRIALLNALKDNHHNVVCNLSDVQFISYMGVGVLVERLRQFRALSGDLKLVGINMYADRLFRMAGVKSLFDICETEAAALHVFEQAA